jgi:hypothetical protein
MTGGLRWDGGDLAVFLGVCAAILLVLLWAIWQGGDQAGTLHHSCLPNGKCKQQLECREWREWGDWRCVPPRGVP